MSKERHSGPESPLRTIENSLLRERRADNLQESIVTAKKHVRPRAVGRDSFEPHKSAIDHLPLDDRSLNCSRPGQNQVLG